jgi:hypothetical protein
MSDISPFFKKDISLWHAKGLSAKVVFSSIAESLIYIFPAEENVLYVDLIGVPVQPILMHGLINLLNPIEQVDQRQIHLQILEDKAIQEYLNIPGSFLNIGRGMGFAERVTLRFNDSIKMLSLKDQALAGFYKSNIEVENNAPWYTEMMGRSSSVNLKLEGLLLFNSEKDFSWVTAEGKRIGKSMAEMDISHLSLSSEFFRQSRAHPKLKPFVDAIQEKKTRAEKDPSFDYPLWQQDMDMRELRELSKPFKIEGSYVDRLLERRPSFSSGFLLWYFKDAAEFMWQWITINAAILILLGLSFMRREKLSIPLKHAIGTYGTFMLVAINIWWVWRAKPDPVTLQYWLLPIAVAVANFILCISIAWKSVRRRIMADEPIAKNPLGH